MICPLPKSVISVVYTPFVTVAAFPVIDPVIVPVTFNVPLIAAFPFTSNFSLGLLLPIPRFPPLVKINLGFQPNVPLTRGPIPIELLSPLLLVIAPCPNAQSFPPQLTTNTCLPCVKLVFSTSVSS